MTTVTDIASKRTDDQSETDRMVEGAWLAGYMLGRYEILGRFRNAETERRVLKADR